MGTEAPGTFHLLDPHIEKAQCAFRGARLLADEDHAVNGLLRCNRCSPSGGEVRAASLQFYRDRVIFFLARAFRTYASGTSERMDTRPRALHLFSIHILKNDRVFAFARPGTGLGSALPPALQFYRDRAMFFLARSFRT